MSSSAESQNDEILTSEYTGKKYLLSILGICRIGIIVISNLNDLNFEFSFSIFFLTHLSFYLLEVGSQLHVYQHTFTVWFISFQNCQAQEMLICSFRFRVFYYPFAFSLYIILAC
jgi:hypothetical protein